VKYPVIADGVRKSQFAAIHPLELRRDRETQDLVPEQRQQQMIGNGIPISPNDMFNPPVLTGE